MVNRSHDAYEQAAITARNIVAAGYFDTPVQQLAEVYLSLRSASAPQGLAKYIGNRQPENTSPWAAHGGTARELLQEARGVVDDAADTHPDLDGPGGLLARIDAYLATAPSNGKEEKR